VCVGSGCPAMGCCGSKDEDEEREHEDADERTQLLSNSPRQGRKAVSETLCDVCVCASSSCVIVSVLTSSCDTVVCTSSYVCMSQCVSSVCFWDLDTSCCCHLLLPSQRKCFSTDAMFCLLAWQHIHVREAPLGRLVATRPRECATCHRSIGQFH